MDSTLRRTRVRLLVFLPVGCWDYTSKQSRDLQRSCVILREHQTNNIVCAALHRGLSGTTVSHTEETSPNSPPDVYDCQYEPNATMCPLVPRARAHSQTLPITTHVCAYDTCVYARVNRNTEQNIKRYSYKSCMLADGKVNMCVWADWSFLHMYLQVRFMAMILVSCTLLFNLYDLQTQPFHNSWPRCGATSHPPCCIRFVVMWWTSLFVLDRRVI